jgi:hypothetical protein
MTSQESSVRRDNCERSVDTTTNYQKKLQKELGRLYPNYILNENSILPGRMLAPLI